MIRAMVDLMKSLIDTKIDALRNQVEQNDQAYGMAWDLQGKMNQEMMLRIVRLEKAAKLEKAVMGDIEKGYM